MTPHRHARASVGLALGAALSLAPAAGAQIAVSANDNKVVSLNGVVTVVPNAPPDTVSVIDLKASPPRVIAEVEAPVSVVGPPLSVAVTPDESLALVTASSKVDPSDPTKQAPDNRLTVIDLTANPLKIIATLEAGKGASGISINRQGTLALVSNLVDGTVSVFTIQGKTVSAAGAVEVGGVKAGGGQVVIAPDGKTALVSRRDDNRISVLSIDGSNRPKDSPFYNDAGKLVIVRVTGKTLSRVAEAPIGHWSQGVAFSPDGKTILVGNMVEKDYWVFQLDGSTLRDTGQRVKVNGGPAAIRTPEK